MSERGQSSAATTCGAGYGGAKYATSSAATDTASTKVAADCRALHGSYKTPAAPCAANGRSRAADHGAAGIVYIKSDLLLGNLARDPHYKALLRKMNLPEWRLCGKLALHYWWPLLADSVALIHSKGDGCTRG
jgi:hypothetical protein